MSSSLPKPPLRPEPIALPDRSPFPLGAGPVEEGTRFAVHSPRSERMEVCLIDDDGREQRIDLPDRTYGIWHGTVPGVGAGQKYGYRAHGPWLPRAGLRTNPHKILLDPWARQLTGDVGDPERLLPHDGDPFGGMSTDDSLGHTPLSVVTGARTVRHRRPGTAWEETVVYELHVGTYTARHPHVPPQLRGTYLGLTVPAVLDHLVRLGVTAVELLPVHASVTEPPVRARGMRNHWGYSTASFFAPHPAYAATPGNENAEFRTMVRALHEAGLEVILDVVYNHTCEWSVAGPSLSWRGLDAPGYYLLDDHGHDIDLTGCGNTVDAASPIAVRMVCDSLRHWASEMGVDGFRFDLASALGRPRGGAFDDRAALFTAITTDPVLTDLKLIAEPWDATGPGYQLGNFGAQWSEWNDRYRDSVRRFWARRSGVREIASRLAGSEDLYGRHVRQPWMSINFVTAHDGFTMADTVSYTRKHNEANGENGRDGSDNNESVNHGIEGPTSDPEIVAARDRHVRALLATLLLSTGTPMLLAGDEFGHSQGGNNNAYCVPADTPVRDAWPLDWAHANRTRIDFVRELLQLRRKVPVLRQRRFFDGRARTIGYPDLVWFGADGTELDDAGWHDDTRRTLQAWVEGSELGTVAGTDQTLANSSELFVLHAGDASTVTLAGPEWYRGTVRCVFDSSAPDGRPADASAYHVGSPFPVTGPAVLVFRRAEIA
ncbi:glycogen debranching protein GlgX [Rhodococcus chondri]|uniref:Glycogen debranching protein GlgX n=1 Tax=Rhodococcus chondri TaxID=3065941 RepID=A0ABU7JT16_9NOCA|nr:glycogen debranching protein GlgX [Rhodococcus sp. CC-R104]MEE2033163.1 glycogen debranching protein GlgX [Rhodococcus sp. CC-R104]